MCADGFPQAFTFNGYSTANGPALRALNDQLHPLWDASDVLLPSIYLGKWTAPVATLAKMNAAQVNTTVLESVRIQQRTTHRPEIWPFAYFYYNSGRQNVTLTRQDAVASVLNPYILGADGLVIWGNPSFKNRTVPHTVTQFKAYFKDVLGPTVAMVKHGASQCADARCHAHGRCVVGGGCECEPGFDDAKNCSGNKS